MTKITLQRLVELFLNALVLLIETFLASRAHRPLSRKGGEFHQEGFCQSEHDRHHKNGKPNSRSDAVLLEAFEFFGFSLKEAHQNPSEIRPMIEKSRRKLSLRHHPDRNNNSEESKKRMQTLNHAYALCNAELDRLEGFTDDDHESIGRGTQNVRSQWASPTAAGDTKTMNTRNNYANEKASKSKRKSGRQPNDPWRSEDNIAECLREEAEQLQKVKHETKHLKQMQRNAAYRHQRRPEDPMPSVLIEVKEVRDRAHREWIEAIHSVQRDQQNRQAEEPRPNASFRDIDDQMSRISAPFRIEDINKPVHKTLENCSDPIVVAIRNGYSLAVAALLSDKAAQNLPVRAEPISLHDLRVALFQAELAIVLQPLDRDGNAFMHYVAYYEQTQIFHESITYFGEHRMELLLQKNCRGQIPFDFCAQASNKIFAERIQMATEAAQRVIAERAIHRQLLVASYRIRKIALRIDIFRVLHTTICIVVIGRHLFGRSYLLSVSTHFLMFSRLSDDRVMSSEEIHKAFFSFHLALHTVISMFQYLRFSRGMLLRFWWAAALLILTIFVSSSVKRRLFESLFMMVQCFSFLNVIVVENMSTIIGWTEICFDSDGQLHFVAGSKHDCSTVLLMAAVGWGLGRVIWPAVVESLTWERRFLGIETFNSSVGS